MGQHAIPLLDKALEILPTYGPALVDKAVSYYMLKDTHNAEIALSRLEAVHPSHPSIESIRSALWDNDGTGQQPKKGGARKKGAKESPTHKNLLSSKGKTPLARKRAPPKNSKAPPRRR
jgi:hypothetical protein